MYFTKISTPERIVDLYNLLIEERGEELKAPVAVKVHSGEPGNQNFLRPEFFAPVINKVDGIVVECNTAYDGPRGTTEKHLETMKLHGWSELFKVDILDGEGPDKVLKVENGIQINENYVGKNIENYASMLVLSHFKGHPAGGYGGALKQISIGVASSFGKKNIHGAGNVIDFWSTERQKFIASMADAAQTVATYFKDRMLYINVMKNMSVDCDCCAKAEDPCMCDIGMLASIDPVALDKACLDLVYNSKDKGKTVLIERIESRGGNSIIDYAEKLGIGSSKYNLINIDKD